MERILVGIDERHPQLEALAHGCSLAKRIQARLYVLFVRKKQLSAAAHSMRQRLELLVGVARADGIQVEYLIAEGGYEEAIISFVHNHGITLLIHEATHADARALGHSASVLQAIRHRVACRVEIVTPQNER